MLLLGSALYSKMFSILFYGCNRKISLSLFKLLSTYQMTIQGISSVPPGQCHTRACTSVSQEVSVSVAVLRKDPTPASRSPWAPGYN